MNSVDSISSWTQLQQQPPARKLASDSPRVGHKSPVSRAITFGTPLSRDKVHKLVREQMEHMSWCDRAKWGFDFLNEKPTNDSKYEWKKSGSDSRDHLNYSFYAYKRSFK